VFNSVTI